MRPNWSNWTYRFSQCHHTVKPNNIWVFKLSDNGRLPQEPDPVFLCGLVVEHLDGYVQVPLLRVPHPPTDRAKLARAKVVLNSVVEK